VQGDQRGERKGGVTREGKGIDSIGDSHDDLPGGRGVDSSTHSDEVDKPKGEVERVQNYCQLNSSVGRSREATLVRTKGAGGTDRK
jgi:hypothetical protein